MITYATHEEALRQRDRLAQALRNLMAVYEVDMHMIAPYFKGRIAMPQPWQDARALLAELEGNDDE